MAVVTYALALRRARRAGPEQELGALRRWHVLRHLEAGLFLVGLASGLVLMNAQGWRLGYPRWLSAKLGLVAFLFAPLEAFRLYISLFWLGPGLQATSAPPFSKDLARALSMEEMLGALAGPLLVLALPIVLWLSWARPF